MKTRKDVDACKCTEHGEKECFEAKQERWIKAHDEMEASNMKRKQALNDLFSCDNCGKSMSPLEQSHLTNEPDGEQTWACKPTVATERNGHTSSGHTPGPLKVGKVYRNNDTEVWIVTDKLFRGTVYAQCNTEESAKLFAAAPELLEALKFVDSYFTKLDEMQPNKDHGTKGNQARQMVKEAIAKAEGR